MIKDCNESQTMHVHLHSEPIQAFSNPFILMKPGYIFSESIQAFSNPFLLYEIRLHFNRSEPIQAFSSPFLFMKSGSLYEIRLTINWGTYYRTGIKWKWSQATCAKLATTFWTANNDNQSQTMLYEGWHLWCENQSQSMIERHFQNCLWQ